MFEDLWWDIKNLRSNFAARYLMRRDVVDIKTLQRGVFCDADRRMLHATFQVLVDFVEIDCAQVAWFCGLVKLTKWERVKEYFYCFRSGSAGLAWLSEKSENKDQDDMHAQIMELYNFWKFERPGRLFEISLSANERKDEVDWEEKEHQMFLKLAEIRQYLWV